MLHLPRSEFYEMTQAEFWEALHAHQEEKTADRQHVGELIRGATIRLFNLQVRKQDQITDPRKFWPMPWDAESSEDEALKELKAMPHEEKQDNARKFLDRIGWSVNDDGSK